MCIYSRLVSYPLLWSYLRTSVDNNSKLELLETPILLCKYRFSVNIFLQLTWNPEAFASGFQVSWKKMFTKLPHNCHVKSTLINYIVLTQFDACRLRYYRCKDWAYLTYQLMTLETFWNVLYVIVFIKKRVVLITNSIQSSAHDTHTTISSEKYSFSSSTKDVSWGLYAQFLS